MGKMNALLHSFNSGELSKAGLARVDQEKVRLCAEVQENLFPYTIGKAIMRPGTKFLGTVSSTITLDNSPPRIIPFVKSVDSKYLLVLGYDTGTIHGIMSVYLNDVSVSYPKVSSTIGDITGFTTVLTGDATVSLATNGFTAACPNLGGTAIVKKEITTSSPNIEHAIEVNITSGSLEIRIGSTDGAEDFLPATIIGAGTHILSFTPTIGTYWVRFFSTSQTPVIVGTGITIYNSGVGVPASGIGLGVSSPWSLAGLRSIRYDQSLDVIFMTQPNAMPCKVERRGDKSWSVTEYFPKNGPFMISRSNDQVRLKPSATYGSVTLTSDNPFFTGDHVGVVFKLTHDNFNASFGLAASGKYTDPFRVTGIKYTGVDDRAFSVTVSGTWSGTINIQRSYNDEYSGFKNFGADIVANGTVSVAGDASDNNAIVWYRVIFTSYTSGSAQIAVSYPGYGGSGICRVTHYNSPTSVTADVLTNFTDTSYTDDWLEGEWSTTRGFPTAVALFDGRLWWSRSDRFWGSVSDNYYSYDVTVVGASASIQRDIATGGNFSEIQWMLPLQRLIFGTAGAEASARASSLDEPLTPTAITVKDGSNNGSANITPVKVDGRGIFVQRSGKKLMELSYGAKGSDYSASDLMRYNETIGTSMKGVRVPGVVDNDIIELAVQRHPETYVWCLRDDGVTPVLLYNPDQDAMGWFKMLQGRSYVPFNNQYLENDKVVSVAVLPGEVEDDVYFLIGRRQLLSPFLEGSTSYVYNLEKLGRHQDAVNNTASASFDSSGYLPYGVSTYNGLYQLDSYETATVDTDGLTVIASYRLAGAEVTVIGPHYDSSGNIISYGPIGLPINTGDLGYDDATATHMLFPLSERSPFLAGATVTIGLAYTGRYKTAKLAYGAQGGTSLLQPKRVAMAGVLMSDYNPNGIMIGSDFDDPNAMDELPKIEKGVLVDTTGTLPATLDGDMFPFPGAWDTDSRLCIEVKPGYSATLNALVVGMDESSR